MNRRFELISTRARLWLRLLIGREEAVTQGQLRNRRIGRGFLSSMAQKGTGLVVSIVSVPLTVHYLGSERYGLWMTITSVLGWLALSDFGLTTSLGLAVADAYGRDNRLMAKRAIASAFYALCAIALCLALGFFLVVPHIPWPEVFKVKSVLARSEMVPAFAVGFICFVMSFPLSIANRVLAAYQEFVTANIWLIAGNLLTLAALVVACHAKASLPVLIACFSGVTVLLNVTLSLWLFRAHKPWLAPSFSAFRIKEAGALTGKGFWFFLGGITWTINSQTDILVISHFLGTAEVTPYAVTARLFSYASLLQGILSGSLIPAYAEAIATKDISWVKRTFVRHFWLSGLTALVICAGFYISGPFIIHHWANARAVPSFHVLSWMAAWNIMLGIAYPIGILLSGLNKPKGMACYGGAAAVVNLVLSILWVKKYGVSGVIAASVVSFAVINIPLALVEVRMRLKKMNAGSDAV